MFRRIEQPSAETIAEELALYYRFLVRVPVRNGPAMK